MVRGTVCWWTVPLPTRGTWRWYRGRHSLAAPTPAMRGARGAAAPRMQILTRAGPGALPSPAPAGIPAVAMATAIYIYIFFPLITGTSRETVSAGGCSHPAEGGLQCSPPHTHGRHPTQSKSSVSSLPRSPQPARGAPVPRAAAHSRSPPSLQPLSRKPRGWCGAVPEPRWGQLVVGAVGPPRCSCSCLAPGSRSPLRGGTLQAVTGQRSQTQHGPRTSSWVKPRQQQRNQTLGCSRCICPTSVIGKGPRAVGSAGGVHTYSHQPHLRDFGSQFPPSQPPQLILPTSALGPNTTLWRGGCEGGYLHVSLQPEQTAKAGQGECKPVRRRQSKAVPGERVPREHRVSQSWCSRGVAVPSMEETLCPAARGRWRGGPTRLLPSQK